MISYKTTSDASSLDTETSAYSYTLQSNEIISYPNDTNFIDDNNLINVNNNFDQYYQTSYELYQPQDASYYYTHTCAMEHSTTNNSNTYPILYPFKPCLFQNGYSFDTHENVLQVMYDDIKLESPITIDTDTSNYIPQMLKQEPSNNYHNYSFIPTKKPMRKRFKDLTEVSSFSSKKVVML